VRVLKDILKGIIVREVTGSVDIPIREITFDSRKADTDTLFVAIKGSQTDGHLYIGQAISNGARAVICQQPPPDAPAGVTMIITEDTAKALGTVARNFYDDPSGKIILVGVTGTNGKTTIATLLYDLFTKLGFRSGLISTVNNRIINDTRPATHTTPDTLSIHALIREMTDKGCDYCFMEVSSHAIHQQRIAGLTFSGALFTNITHDHLDYHKTFQEYVKAKKRFFDQLPPDGFALVNKDDRNGQVMIQNCEAKIHTYALRSMADFTCRILEQHRDGTLISIDNRELWTHLIGEFNMYNLLCVYSCALILGLPKNKVPEALSELRPVKGRMDTIITGKGVTAIVDYAHTPDALSKVLQTLQTVGNKKASLITVVGAGGNRDRSKRPLMAKIACDYSDKVILTSDNPRSENPEDIIRDMLDGADEAMKKKTVTIINREEAIKSALFMAREGDIVLVAGKGHENYQEIAGVRHHFDDKEVIARLEGGTTPEEQKR
jgi:UDP-N-acetylmuramoyl-L-alanyl-D-glutamate--2,6-diaminopimelate ligase